MNTKNDKRIILEKALLSVASIIFTVDILYTYGKVLLLLDPDTFQDNDFWNPIAIINTSLKIGISALIVYNTRINFQYRNYFARVEIYNVDTLYLMCIPTLVVVIVTSLLTSIRYIVQYDCFGFGSAVTSLSTIVFFVSVLVLLIETNTLIDYGECWTVNFSNFSTILLTITCLFGYSIINIGTEQANLLDNIMKINALDCKNRSDLYNIIDNTSRYMQSFQHKSTIIFCITCTIFLMNPLLRNYVHLKKFQLEQNVINNSAINQNITPNYTILCLFLSTIFAISTISIIAPLNNLYINTTYEILTIIVYFLLIFSTVSLLNFVQYWKELIGEQRSIIKIIIWIGFSGGLIQSLTIIVEWIYHDYRGPADLISLAYFVIFPIEITFQNILENVLICKNWEDKSKDRLHLVRPLLLFMGLCNLLLALSDMTHFPRQYNSFVKHKFLIRTFGKLMDNVGLTFSSLLRLNGAVLFLYLFFSLRSGNVTSNLGIIEDNEE